MIILFPCVNNKKENFKSCYKENRVKGVILEAEVRVAQGSKLGMWTTWEARHLKESVLL